MSYGFTGTISKQIIVSVEISVLKKEKILEIEDAMKTCLNQKIEKLNTLFKVLNIYKSNGHLLINDKYGVIPNITQIVSAFGLDIKQVETTLLKGNSYIISDKIVKFLELAGENIDIGENIEALIPNEEIKALIQKNKFLHPEQEELFERDLLQIYENIKKNDKYSIKGTQTIESHYHDDRHTGTTIGEVVSEKNSVEERVKKFLKNVGKIIEENNQNMQKGTSELIFHRARQMGYSVEKKQIGTQIQLVLVRVNG